MTDEPKILSFGEVLWDLFPDGARFGGAPANFASHVALLGGEVSMASAVGNDARGREAIRNLEILGVDTSLVQVLSGATTGTVGVETDSMGKPRYAIHEDAAWDRIDWNPELAARIEGVDALYFGTLSQRSDVSRRTLRRALERAGDSGVLRVLDINLRAPFFSDALIEESLENADLLKFSDEELPPIAAVCGISPHGSENAILQDIAEKMSLPAIVMTRGSQGALFHSPSQSLEQPGIPTEVVDTVGAGDSFTAAFVLGWLRGKPIDQVLDHACRTASSVCAHAGAIPNPVPSRI